MDIQMKKALLVVRCSLGYSALFRAGLMLAISAVWGCGGGPNTPPTPPTPDFSLSVSSASVKVAAGATATVSVAVTGTNGFSYPVAVGISGLPSGVSVSPTNLQVAPGQPVTVTFTAAPYLSPSTSSLTFSGNANALSHTAATSLAVTPYAGNISVPRTRYTRTDAATPYFTWPNSNWIVFDSPTNRFFETDPSTNQVMVLDAATQTEIGAITVPGAFGIDETPDHTTLYVGTQIGDVYAIDPVGMKVVHRYIASEIGPSGYQAYSVHVLANGNLALLGSQGGVPGVDGYRSFAVWNPLDNSITTDASYIDGGISSSNNCTSSGNIFELTLTGDRTTIVLSAGNSLCTLNTVTGKVNSAPIVGFPVSATPDGKSLLVLQQGGIGQGETPPQILVLNAQTLAQTGTIALGTDAGNPTEMFVTPDSSTVYIGEGGAVTSFIYAYNLATGQQIGWLPNLFLSPIVGGTASGPIYNPDFQAIDNTGLLAGPMEEGVGFLDTTALRTGPVGTATSNGYLNPSSGPTSGGTQFQIPFPENLGALYLGKNLASSISLVGNGLFEGTTPTGRAGYVDVYGVLTDGGLGVLPEAFSYGPTIIEATPNFSTADGGGTGILYGYGFGPTVEAEPPIGPFAIPADLQITIGGKQAKITSYNPNAYPVDTPPYPLQSATFTIPAGTSGGADDITITTDAGSTTLSAGMSYLPATQQFSLSGAALAQGIYDPMRDLYYFTDTAEIRVFSKTKGQWLTPIQIPAGPAGTTHRLWGIALSPDGSKLAVSDQSADAIYLMDPANPGSAQSFPVSTYFSGSPFPTQGVFTEPAGLAIDNAGNIYFATSITGGSGYDGLFKIDTATGKVTDYGVGTFNSNLFRVAVTSDGAKAFFNVDGEVVAVNTATNTVTYAAAETGCCYGDYDLTLSAGQTTLEATSYLYDTDLNAESYLTANDRESFNITYVYGTKLSPDGRLLFQPSTNGIDVFDGRLGTLRSRIALPFALSQNFDALVGDGKDNSLIAITGVNGDGIAIVDLSSLTEPAPLPYSGHHASMAHLTGLHGHPALRTVPGNKTNGSAAHRVLPGLQIKHVTNKAGVASRLP
jgi:hypothetical protein